MPERGRHTAENPELHQHVACPLGVLRSGIGVIHQAGHIDDALAAAGSDGLLESVEDQRGAHEGAARQPRMRRE